MGYLTGGEIGTLCSMHFPSILPGMLFRPEENAFLSESIDDVGILQAGKINLGDKDNRMAFRFQAAAIHVTVDLHLHGTLAMGAFRFNLNDYVLPP